MPVATRLTDGELAQRQRDPDHDDRREDQPPHEPQAGGRDRGELAAGHGLADSAGRAARARGRRARRSRTRRRRWRSAVIVSSCSRDERGDRDGIGPGMAHEATPARARGALRGSEALRTALGVLLWTRGAVLLVAVFAALSFGPASGRLARDQRALRRARPDPAARRLRRHGALAARALGRRLVPADRRRRLRRRRLAAPPSSRSTRCSCAAVGGSAAARGRAADRRLSPSRWRPSWRRWCCSRGSRRSSWAGGSPRPTLLLLAVFPARSSSARPTRRASSCSCSVGAFYAARTGHWALAGLAGGAAPRPAAPGSCCSCRSAILWWQSRPRPHRPTPAWLLLVARWAGRLRRSGWRLVRRRARFSTSREILEPRVRGPAGRRLGRVRGGLGRRAPAALGLARRRSTSSRPRGDPFRIARHQPDAVRLPGVRARRPASACCGGCRSPTAPGWSSRCCCRCRSRSTRSR